MQTKSPDTEARVRLTPAEAETAFRRLLGSEPKNRPIRDKLVALLKSQSRWDEAERLLWEAAALAPGDKDITTRLALEVLANGRYAEGWKLYEARRGATGVNGVTPPTLPYPEWDGAGVGSLLIWPEQGFGDMIQFARFIPEVARRGVRPTLLCPPVLADLFATAGLNIVVAKPEPGGGVMLPRHDAWALLGSLPLRLGVTLETLPPPLPLSVEAPGPAGGVGVVAQGRPSHPNDAHRSLPPEWAAELMALPGAVSLDPEDSGARDFLETAKIVAGLDRVVTVDTAAAHLAGSMGKPTHLLLPKHSADWRWLHDRDDSPWYPSMKLYRQPEPGDWASVFERLRQDLAAAR
jgi:hypothetical protein